jgi:hypothetical protein
LSSLIHFSERRASQHDELENIFKAFMNKMSNELISKHRTSSMEIKENKNILNVKIYIYIKAQQPKPNVTRDSKLSCVNLVRPYGEKLSKKNSKCNSTFVGGDKSTTRVNYPEKKNVQIGEFWSNIENRIKILKSRISPAHSNKSGNSVNSAQSRSGSVYFI